MSASSVIAALGQLVRGLAARRWSSVALLVTAVLTVGAAVLGPLFARAAQESVLQAQLTAQPVDRTGVHLGYSSALTMVAADTTAARAAPPARFTAAYPTRELATRVTTLVQAPGSQISQQTRVVWRDGFCAHLVVVSGRCPTDGHDAMLSERTVASGYGYTGAGTVTLPEFRGAPTFNPDSAQVSGSTASGSLRVVGVYRPKDPQDRFWFGTNYFNAFVALRDSALDVVDAVFTGHGGLAGFAGPDGEVDVDYPLEAAGVRLADVADTRAATERVLAKTGVSTVRGALPTVLDGIRPEQDQVSVGSLLVSLQLAALAVLVLFVVARDALEARGPDVALAKLRGLPPAATVRFLLAEPLVLTVVAVPLGVLTAWGGVQLMVGAPLVAGVPVALSRGVWVAAAAALAAGIAAAGLAAWRVLTRPVTEQWKGARRRPGRERRGLLVDVAVAAAATGAVVVLTTGVRGAGSATLLAPGLLVVAVALLGVRLLPLAARAALPVTRGSARLGSFLAVRQVARRPAALRLSVLLAVAVGLAVFAVAGESVAATNRTDRAHVESGAARSVTVTFPVTADPVALTHTADPAGTWAMAVAKWSPDGGGTVVGDVLGVDPSRLAAVAFASSQGASTATIAAAIGPPTPPPVAVTGTSLRLAVTTTSLTGSAPPNVLVEVQATNKAAVQVRTGPLTLGAAQYAVNVPCSSGCRLVSVSWDRPIDTFDELGGDVTVTGLDQRGSGAAAGVAAWTPVSLGLEQADGWTPVGGGDTTDAISASADGIHDRFSSSGGGSAGLLRRTTPGALPVWSAPGSVARVPTTDGSTNPLAVTDANRVPAVIAVAGTSSAVPGLGGQGVLADAGFLRERLTAFTAEAAWSVWLGPAAPPDALARLTAAGLTPGAVTASSQRVDQLARQGPALALSLLLVCAILAAVLALGATATAVAVTGHRRAFELAALRLLGVRRGALTRATVLEQLALLGVGVVLGVPTGIAAAVLAMPVIPQFSDTSPLPLHDTPSAIAVIGVAVTLVVAVGAVAGIAGVLLVRSAVPTRLRATA